MTRKTTAAQTTKKAEPKPTPTTGPRSGKTTRRKPRAADNGHTLVTVTGPYQTRSGRFEVLLTCQCGWSARPYVASADDKETGRKAHARHVSKVVS